MSHKFPKTIFILLLVSLYLISCTVPIKNEEDQVSNESYQDAQTNFSELKILFKNKQYDEAYALLKDMEKNLPYSR